MNSDDQDVFEDIKLFNI